MLCEPASILARPCCVVGSTIEALMKAIASKLLLIACMLGSAASPTAAQTGRIAHYSHGGSAATLVAGTADNFGYPVTFRVQEIKRISDSTAVRRGYYSRGHSQGNNARMVNDTIQFLTHDQRAVPDGPNLFLPSCGLIQSLETIRRNYPEAVFTGFDNVQQRVPPGKETKPTPKKPSGQTQAFPRRPFQYSYWRGLAGAAALGAVGWLLGRKPGAKAG
jgi:hypothetical protein